MKLNLVGKYKCFKNFNSIKLKKISVITELNGVGKSLFLELFNSLGNKKYKHIRYNNINYEISLDTELEHIKITYVPYGSFHTRSYSPSTDNTISRYKQFLKNTLNDFNFKKVMK